MCRGLSELYGLWKMYWRLRRSSARPIARPAGVERSFLKRISPPAAAWSPMIARARVVLPEPDSPTSARHSCGRSSSETSCRTWLAPWNASSSRTASSASALSSASMLARSRRSRRSPAGRSPSCAEAATRMPVLELDSRRLRFATGGTHLWAARREHAARWSAARGRRRARGSPRARACPRCPGSPRSSLRVYGCPGRTKSRSRRPGLDESARVHHEHALRRGSRRRRGRG